MRVGQPGLLRGEPVADTTLGLDQLGSSRVDHGKVSAQTTDVDIDGASIEEILLAPDLPQQRLAAEDLAWVANEEGEQVELAGAQIKRGAA
jgi:hypothetical protein